MCGQVFDLNHFNFKFQPFNTLIRKLLNGVDDDPGAKFLEDMQDILEKFSAASVKIGLTISLKKSLIVFTPAPDEPDVEPDIFVNGTWLEVVVTFWNVIYRDRNLNCEILLRIQDVNTVNEK